MSLMLGCAGNQLREAGTGQDGTVSISRITPSSGRAGEAYPIEVTIEGYGFSEEGNTVTFGDIELLDVGSSDGGTRILFWVPKEKPSLGEAPPEILEPGDYLVTVTTNAGTSEPVTFVLTPGS